MRKLCEPITVSSAGLVRAVHRHVLAKDVMVPDPQPGRLPVVFQVLRRLADHAAGVEAVVRADGRQAGQIDLRADDAVRADLHAFINDRVRSDSDRRVQFRLGMNDSGWMNHQSQKWANRPDCQAKTSNHAPPSGTPDTAEARAPYSYRQQLVPCIGAATNVFGCPNAPKWPDPAPGAWYNTDYGNNHNEANLPGASQQTWYQAHPDFGFNETATMSEIFPS